MQTGEHTDPATRVDVAIRSDETAGATEVAGFFGSGSRRLFGAFTLPVGDPVASVFISSPLFAEQARNYRREVILARDLASRGIAVFRYHYRGTGHSDGDSADLTFSTMCADATEAFDRLRQRCPGIPHGFVGTRLGAFVAATVARDQPVAPLLLWDPVSSASIVFKEAIKARKVGGMVAEKQTGATPEGELDVWAEGYLDSLGFRVPRGLRESLEQVSLPECLGPEGRKVLIVTVVARHEPTTQAETVAGLLRESTAATVDVRRLDGRLTWWTSRDSWDPDEDHPVTREVTTGSADWLERHLVGGANGS